MEVVEKVIVQIERILGMELIGVDFIVDSKDPSKIYCIDINLFPSYTGFENVSTVMGNFIIQKCTKSFVCFILHFL